MTEEQRNKFYELCIHYRFASAGEAEQPYVWLRDYVETLIDEAVKYAINAHKANKE